MTARFRFTPDQRARLLCCWKRQKDRANAEIYLSAAEPNISFWLVWLNRSGQKRSEIRDATEEFGRLLHSLIGFMDQKRECLGGIATGQDEVPEREVRAAAAQLRASAATLAKAAEIQARAIAVNRGPDNTTEAQTVSTLAELYRMIFSREPSNAPGSNFRLFMTELGEMIGIEFGPETIRAGIADTLRFVPGNIGWHYFEGEFL